MGYSGDEGKYGTSFGPIGPSSISSMEFYIEKKGSMDYKTLKELASKGQIEPGTVVYIEYLEIYVKAASIAGLFNLVERFRILLKSGPIPKFRIIGLTLIALGVICLFCALVMKTYISTESLGSVYNIGLLSEQTNYVVISVGLILIGTIALAYSFMIKPDDKVKECPDCSESVKIMANKCKFCGHIFNE